MTTYTQGWRDLLLPLDKYTAQYPDPLWLGITVAMSVGVFVLGLVVWHRYEWRFPEVI